MNNDMVAYYKARALEYEKIYARPERQASLAQATSILQDLFAGKNVCEIACGTGYWTQQISQTARSIIASDINHDVVEIARKKEYGGKSPSFHVQDFYTLSPEVQFQSLFGGFIWSHIKREQLPVFLQKVCSMLIPGALVVFMDSLYIEGSNHPISHTDSNGNTFQTRTLENGTKHHILKNFPTRSQLEKYIEPFGVEITYVELKYYWVVSFVTK